MALPAFSLESALGKMQDVPMRVGKKSGWKKKNKFCVGSVKIIHPVFFLDFYNFSFVGRCFGSIAYNTQIYESFISVDVFYKNLSIVL